MTCEMMRYDIAQRRGAVHANALMHFDDVVMVKIAIMRVVLHGAEVFNSHFNFFLFSVGNHNLPRKMMKYWTV